MYMAENCNVDIMQYVYSTTTVLPVKLTTGDGASLRYLRALQKVVFLDGLETIGDYWFSNANIQSVEIPASVKCIGNGAFFRCKKLKLISLAKDGALEKIGIRCFQETKIIEFCAPAQLKEIGAGAFTKCKQLKKVTLNEGIESLPKEIF